MNDSYQEYINFANTLADAASVISMQYFRKPLNIDNKNDQSPVTIADKNTELKIRSMIENKYPNHGILGEEFDNINPNAEFIWVIDPIDGTRSYIAGHKDFGNLISLTQNKKPIIGIINCPAHDERWVGFRDQNSTVNNQTVKTSNVTSVSSCFVLPLWMVWVIFPPCVFFPYKLILMGQQHTTLLRYFEAIIVNFSTYYFIKIKVAVKCMQMFAVSFTLLGWGTKKPQELFVYVVVPEKLTF